MTGPKSEQIGVVGAHVILWIGTLVWITFEWLLLAHYFTHAVPAFGELPSYPYQAQQFSSSLESFSPSLSALIQASFLETGFSRFSPINQTLRTSSSTRTPNEISRTKSNDSKRDLKN